MTIANSEAEEGAEVMLLLKEAEKRLEEAQTILDACEKYDIDVKLYKGFLARDKAEYEKAMNAIELETPSLMEEDAYPPRALEEALDKHELYKARSTVELVEHTYGMIKDLLNISAKLVRITPTEELITLPPGVTYPHEIPLQVKLLNVLGEPLAGKHINFFGLGKLQVNPGAADTNKNGIVSATINIWKEIEDNLTGSSVEVYIIASGGRKIELRYIFAKPGKPASIVTASRPQAVGASGAQLPDPWVVIVKDADGNTINNISLTVKFEALNEGKVSPEKTIISVQEGESVSVEEAYFSTRLTLGTKDKENCQFRVGIIEPSGYSFNAEITVQSDETSSYGEERQLPTSVAFSVHPKSLAVDTLTSDITGYPLEASFSAPVEGVTVTKEKHEHYKTVKVEGEEVSVLDFSHPFDRVSNSRSFDEQKPLIIAKPSGVVSIDGTNQTLKTKRVGQTEIKATTPGITGYEKAHPKCDTTTFVKTGTLESELAAINVAGIKAVDYECKKEGDYFYLEYPGRTLSVTFEVEASVTVSDGLWVDYLSGNSRLHLDVKVDGNITFTQDKNRAYAGVLEGIGIAWVTAYLKDSDGKEHYRREVCSLTLNEVKVEQNPYPMHLPAGDIGELKIFVDGGASMGQYRCEWDSKPGNSQEGIKGSFSKGKTSFKKLAHHQWVSKTFLSYPENCVEPVAAVAAAGIDGDTWQASILKSGEEPKISTYWHSTHILSARLNELHLKAKRANEAGELYLAFSYDLFNDGMYRNRTLLKLLPVGTFGKDIEKVLGTYVQWSLGDSPYEGPPDICAYSMRSDEAIAQLSLEKIEEEEVFGLYLTVREIKKSGETNISAMLTQAGLSEWHSGHSLTQGKTSLFSANAINLTLNLIRIENIEEYGESLFRLVIDGPAEMIPYHAKWNFIFHEAPPLSEEKIFYQSDDGNWISQIEEQKGLKSVEAEIINFNGLTVGTCEFTPIGTKLLVSTPSVKRAKGESFPVGVEVRNVEDMASFQLTLGFDPKILEAIEASGGALLEGGEGGYFKSEIDNEKGEVYLVGSTFPTISDDGTLASVSFKAKEEGESLFTFKNAYLYAPKNTLIPCAILTKKIVVQSRPLSDVNQDGVVDISDLVIIGKHFGEAPPTVPEADINKDGKVDISDLVLAAQLFGEESGIVAAP